MASEEKIKQRLEKAQKRLRVVKAALSQNRERRDEAVARLHDLHDEFTAIAEQRQELADKPSTPDREAKLTELHKRQVALQKKIDSKDTERDKATARAHELVERQKWFIKRKTVLRKKLKKARQEAQNGQPRYEAWMANGYDDNVVPGVKEFIARGVVRFDLVCTSLHRTYVPPGGSTTSYHLNTPGRAGDIAGSRMSEFQTSEFNRGKGSAGYLELFGPINYQWLKYGGVTGGGEGTPLENLHDTHVHGAFAQ